MFTAVKGRSKAKTHPVARTTPVYRGAGIERKQAGRVTDWRGERRWGMVKLKDHQQ